jgi:hypothetical protein
MPKKIKKSRVALLFALLFFISCVSENKFNIRIEAPGKIVLDLDRFSEIFITDFLIKSQTKDLDLNTEIIDYFSSELGTHFKGKISTKKITLEKEEVFKNEDFWKNLSDDKEKTLFLTGNIQYKEEVRKSVIGRRKKDSEDPFQPERTLAEQRFYLLNLDLYFIDGKTGKALYKKSFKESRNYQNPEQTAYFAFFDLIKAVKEKLYRDLLGERRIQQRYLIIR